MAPTPEPVPFPDMAPTPDPLVLFFALELGTSGSDARPTLAPTPEPRILFFRAWSRCRRPAFLVRLIRLPSQQRKSRVGSLPKCLLSVSRQCGALPWPLTP